MKDIIVLFSIAAYGVALVVWLMSWKSQTDKKFVVMLKTLNDIHSLSNSDMDKQLSLNVVVTKRLADMTGDKDDLDQARLSKKWHEEHQARQAVVDAVQGLVVNTKPRAAEADGPLPETDIEYARVQAEQLSPLKVPNPRARRVRKSA